MGEETMDQAKQDYVVLAARICLSAVFIMSGLHKLLDFEGTVAQFTSLGLPLPPAATVLTIVVWLAGGLGILVGYRVRDAAILLILYTLAATFIAHAFWTFPPEARTPHINGFFLNFAVIGGLMMMVAHGPGRHAVGRKI